MVRRKGNRHAGGRYLLCYLNISRWPSVIEVVRTIRTLDGFKRPQSFAQIATCGALMQGFVYVCQTPMRGVEWHLGRKNYLLPNIAVECHADRHWPAQTTHAVH